MKKEYFTCLELHRDDIKQQGFDTSTLNDDDMQVFANKIGESLMDLFWTSLDTLADERFELKKLEVSNKKCKKCQENEAMSDSDYCWDCDNHKR